jgi:hypothetical protein
MLCLLLVYLLIAYQFLLWRGGPQDRAGSRSRVPRRKK